MHPISESGGGLANRSLLLLSGEPEHWVALRLPLHRDALLDLLPVGDDVLEERHGVSGPVVAHQVGKLPLEVPLLLRQTPRTTVRLLPRRVLERN